jgi:hypothetical protein
MATYYLERDDELAIVKESPYGTSVNPVAADFFKHTSSSVSIAHALEETYRDRDRDGAQASVLTRLIGRSKSTIGIECDLIPSGVAAGASALTPPDIDNLLEAVFGSRLTATAKTTTAAGSTGTTLNLATGGGSASGIAIGQLIGVDVDSTNGIEVRQVTNIATDTVTIDRALTANPVAGRNVYTGVTFRLSQSSLISLAAYLFNGAAQKYKVPGIALNECDFSINLGENVPVGKFRFTGEGLPETTHAVARPTPTTNGVPLVPSLGKIWLGATRYPVVTAGFNVKNGIELRNNESDGLVPTALRRTGNNSRYVVEGSIEAYLTSDLVATYDAAKTRTAIDAIVQLGATAGAIFAWRLPKWGPRAERMSQGGELGIRLSGRALGTSADDEITCAFL